MRHTHKLPRRLWDDEKERSRLSVKGKHQGVKSAVPVAESGGRCGKRSCPACLHRLVPWPHFLQSSHPVKGQKPGEMQAGARGGATNLE